MASPDTLIKRFNNIYILQCKKAIDIQKESSYPNKRKNLGKTQLIQVDSEYKIISTEYGDFYAINTTRPKPEIFWIPRPDELHVLLKQKKFAIYGQIYDYKLDVKIRTFLSTILCTSGLQTLTYPEMWLRYTMKVIYNKQWEGKQWK